MKLFQIILVAFVLLPFAVAGEAVRGTQTPSLEQILRQMDEHDLARAESGIRYTCLRRYTLENKRFHKKAELSVRMTFTSPGHKDFEVLSEQGPSVIRQKVLRPMLAAEEESGQDDIRPRTRMVVENYDFKLLGADQTQDRPSYLLEVAPKTKNKFLIRGKVWIDAKDFGIIRVEATPAQNPSIFIHNTQVIQQSERMGDLWLPLFNHSNTDSFLFGHTEVTIDSWDYKIAKPETLVR